MENLIMKYSKEIFGADKDKTFEVNWFNGDITKIKIKRIKFKRNDYELFGIRRRYFYKCLYQCL